MFLTSPRNRSEHTKSLMLLGMPWNRSRQSKSLFQLAQAIVLVYFSVP